jgi:hypothetical protein
MTALFFNARPELSLELGTPDVNSRPVDSVDSEYGSVVPRVLDGP